MVIFSRIEVFNNRLVMFFWDRGSRATWDGRGKHLRERAGATAAWRARSTARWEADSVAPDAGLWGGCRGLRGVVCVVLVWAREGGRGL